MKHTTTLLALVLLPLAAGAQEAVTAGGGTAEGGDYALTYSVGQTAVATAADGQLREGVVQPITVEEVGVPGGAELSSTVTVFPNPTMDGLTVRQAGPDAVGAPTLQVKIYSQSGQLLGTVQGSDKGDVHIDLGAYAAGVYMLQVNDRTFKITKQ